MEITCMKDIGTDVEFCFACSKCKQEAEANDKFCRHCGNRLRKIPLRVSMDKICGMVTTAIRDTLDESSSGSPEKEAKEDGFSKTTEERNENKADASDKQESACFRVSCPRCKPEKNGCECLGLDGLCYGIVYPTNPPQIDKCVFDR